MPLPMATMVSCASGLLACLLFSLLCDTFATDCFAVPTTEPPPRKLVQRQWEYAPLRCSQLHLRGGGAQDDDLARLEANLAALSQTCDKMNMQLDDGKDRDVMGISPQGIPMSFTPQNAEIVEEPEYDSEEFSAMPKQGPWEPREDDLRAAMEMVDWLQEAADSMSPESILEGIKRKGASPKDLEPVLNWRGTRLGNIEQLDKSRERLTKTLAEARETHALLRKSMEQRSATDELKEEIDQMGEEDINPYVRLLHEWKKNSEHEHESGAFSAQHAAATKPRIAVPPAQVEPEGEGKAVGVGAESGGGGEAA